MGLDFSDALNSDVNPNRDYTVLSKIIDAPL